MHQDVYKEYVNYICNEKEFDETLIGISRRFNQVIDEIKMELKMKILLNYKEKGYLFLIANPVIKFINKYPKMCLIVILIICYLTYFK